MFGAPCNDWIIENFSIGVIISVENLSKMKDEEAK